MSHPDNNFGFHLQSGKPREGENLRLKPIRIKLPLDALAAPLMGSFLLNTRN
jgi:hypothetical protein